MLPLYFEKKIVKKLIEHDAIVLLADGFNELNIVALFIFYFHNKALWYENYLIESNLFFELFKLNIFKAQLDEEQRKHIDETGDREDEPESEDEIEYLRILNENESFVKSTKETNKNNEKKDKESCNQNNNNNKKKKKKALEDKLENRGNVYYSSSTNSDHVIAKRIKDSYHKTDEYGDNRPKENKIGTNFTFQLTYPKNENKLIFILNVSPKEYVLFLKYQMYLYKEIKKFDQHFNKDVKINYLKTEYIRNQKSLDRIEMYIKRGIYFISSNILLIDLLTFKIIPELIDGIFICKNHKLIYSMKETFIIEIYRRRNKFGFIKGITNNKKLVHSTNLSNVAKKMYIKHIFCYPRFHKVIHNTLNNTMIQPDIYELNLELNPETKRIEENILSLIQYLNVEIKKDFTYSDFDINLLLYSDSAEGYIMNYIKNKNLNYNTKKILKEIILLVDILYNLYNYDSLLFYNFLNNLKEPGKESTWMYCNESNEIFYLANERKNEYLKNIVGTKTAMINDVQTLEDLIQNQFSYLSKSYAVKAEQDVRYNWLSELIFQRDITHGSYQKIQFKYQCERKWEIRKDRVTELIAKTGSSEIYHTIINGNTNQQNKVKVKRERTSDGEEIEEKLQKPQQPQNKKQKNQEDNKETDKENFEKVEYPILILVDNFYAQKEIYNSLLYTSENGTLSTVDSILTKPESQKPIVISDDSSSKAISKNTSENNKEKNKKEEKEPSGFTYFIPYESIKHKTKTLKFIKPKVYILCINKYYENVYCSDAYIEECYKVIDSINADVSGESTEEELTAETNSNTRLFEINEYSGNLDFLELFLMKVKPLRIILTELNLSIFRCVEIYCARLFKYYISLLRENTEFLTYLIYEKVESLAQVEATVPPVSHSFVKKENLSNIKTEEGTKDIVKQLKESELVSNCVEVFLLFYKDNMFYNKYLNSIKMEKSNWLSFLEQKNALRLDVDRNVFNKNRKIFNHAIQAYFNFQQKFKENKKNIANFNKALCNEFKNFQEVKSEEVIQNTDAFVSNLNSNFISMEEEDVFLSSLRSKGSKSNEKRNNELMNIDEKTINTIQELLHNYITDSFNLNFILYSIFNNIKPIVIVDVRELKSDLSYKLYKSKIHIIPYSLLVGDYIVTKDICVERKTIVDLIQSLNNNRLYNQISQMSKYYAVFVLLIEFNSKHLFYFSSLNDKNSVYTKLSILCLQFPKLKILWSHYSLFTVKLFWALKINSSQPDIFKALHIDMTLQKGVKESNQNKKEEIIQHNEINDASDLENEQGKEYKYETIHDLFDPNLQKSTSECEEGKPEETKTIKKRKKFRNLENATNLNAIEVLKCLPGITDRNIQLLVNNVNSLNDLCNKKLEELEQWMSKKNAKLLYDFINNDVNIK